MPDSVEALARLGVTLDPAAAGRFRGIRFIGPENSVEAYFPRGVGLGIRRTLLHDALCERAQRLGVRMLWGARVGHVSPRGVRMDGEEVRCRWIVGADGQNSQVRRWAGLSAGKEYERRIGLRQHFQLAPWSDFVEIYWGEEAQAYVTPIAANEVCVALISRKKIGYDTALARFPALSHRLQGAPRTTAMKGAVTVSRRLHAVARGNVLLIGEASGSPDAITGEGLALSFRQAIALADALHSGALSGYEAAHRDIGALPQLLGRTMLLLDRYGWFRSRALRALSGRPRLFERLLAVHVGELPLGEFGFSGILGLGWQILTA
jgi:flavin-dependent dehydrogenase